MDASAYPFIDIAALDPVRGRFAAGEALLLLDVELENIVWANAPGAALIGADDLIAAVGMESGLGAIARRQIMGAPGYHRHGHPTQVLVRISGRAVSLAAERINLPDGEPGILLSATETLNPKQASSRSIAGFAESGQYLAIIDHEGAVQAATEGFETLGFTPDVLAGLIAGVDGGRDRLVKRRLRIGGRVFPVGFARLTENPARHLLVTIDDVASAPEPSEPIASVEPENERLTENALEGSPVGEPAHTASGTTQSRTIRFLWRTDESGRINAISDEFVEAIGAGTESLVGKRFSDLTADFGIDRDGAIAALLERRDTWSGRSVVWPIGELGVPVDLAALPAYSRDRTFEGFRGFGVARFGDAQPLAENVPPTAPASPDTIEVDASDADIGAPMDHLHGADRPPPFDAPKTPEDTKTAGHGESAAPEADNAAETSTTADDKVIQLSDRRERALSQAERNAFREIGDRLRSEESDKAGSFGKRRAEPPAFEAAQPDAVNAEPPADVFEVPRAIEDDTLEQAEPAGGAEQVVADAWNDGEAIDDLDDDETGHDGQALAELHALDGFNDDDGEAPPAPPADTSIVERLPVPVMIHTGDDLHYANPEFLSLTGYSSVEQLANAGGLDTLFVQPFNSDEEHGERQLHLRRKDGIELPIDALLRSVKWRAGNALMLVIRVVGGDGTAADDKAALSEARARLAEMRTIVDTATDGVVMIDSVGSIRSISRPAEALFGFESDDLAGKPFTSLFAIESQGIAREYLSSISGHGVASLLNDGREVIGRESQGRFIPLFMTIGKMPNNAGFCAVLRDVTQWKRAEEELSQSRRQAERASSQKTDFLARVSHEIRTPLNAIIGFSELMIDEKFGPIANDRYRDYLRDINRSGNHVLDLVNDLLDITKIEAGEQEMSYEPVALNDTLAETVSIMQPQANRDRVIIRSSFATRLPQIVADLRSVRQIALNILSNAVRYTQAGGQVIISTAQETNGDIVMRVRDTGIGMSQAEIEQALKPFKQINALNRKRGDGTGLGLPLTKAMVEANRARFVITSSPNEGTLVEVVFPSTRVLTR